VSVTEVKKVIVWGNHSMHQFPDISKAQVDGKRIQTVIIDDDFLK